MQSNIRQILKVELQRRLKDNPRYSLRAFAKALRVSPTLLSLVMSGQRKPSSKLVQKVSSAISLSPYQTKKLYQTTLQAKLPDNVKDASVHDEFSEISLETFSVISEWCHFAILSLMEISSSKFDARWISKRLGIREIEARLAMNRLLDLKLIGKVNGRWRQISPPLKLENHVSTGATRRFHSDHLKLALASLENDPLELREHCGVTMAMHPDVIPEAKNIIKTFRRELMHLLEQKHEPSEVYHLSIQLFPISKKEET